MNMAKGRPLASSAPRTPVALAGARNRATTPGSAADWHLQLKELRKQICFTQVEFAPFLDVSLRTLASMEGGKKTIGRQELKAIVELKRLVSGLSEIMPATEVGQWLKTANDAFGGFKPLELVDRGEVDRIYEMIYVLKAGIPG